ncbi:MAG TPA: HlyD family efflux transporter periplasmic adaptor subunit [Gammaproteobacteria bacterium]
MNRPQRQLLAMVTAMMCISAQAEPGIATPVSATQASIIQVQPAQTGASVTLGGTVVPYKQVTLTAQIPGRIEFIAGTEGDRFKAQDILVTVDDDDLLAQRRAALAALGNAQAEIANAQMQYSRELISPQAKSLYRSGGMGMPSMFDQVFTQPFSGMMPGNAGGDRWVDRQADLYSYGSRLSQAQGTELSARSQIDQIDARLRDARSFAPFDGVIVKKMVEVGDTVQPGMQLLEYADTTYLQVRVEVPSRLMPSLSKGQLLPARLDVGNTRVEVRVAQIFPSADAVRHTVTVKFDLPEGVPGGPGMYAEVLLPDSSAPSTVVPVIPDSAVLWRGALPAIYVLNDQDQPQLRLIRLGDYVSNDEVSVLSGLVVGERIFAHPPASTASGWTSGNPDQKP